MSFPFIPPKGHEDEAIKEYSSNMHELRPYVAGAAATVATVAAAPSFAPIVAPAVQSVASAASKIPWTTTAATAATVGVGVASYETTQSVSYKIAAVVIAILIASRFFSK